MVSASLTCIMLPELSSSLYSFEILAAKKVQEEQSHRVTGNSSYSSFHVCPSLHEEWSPADWNLGGKVTRLHEEKLGARRQTAPGKSCWVTALRDPPLKTNATAVRQASLQSRGSVHCTSLMHAVALTTTRSGQYIQSPWQLAPLQKCQVKEIMHTCQSVVYTTFH